MSKKTTHSDKAKLYRSQFATLADVERRGARRIPRFAYDFLSGGTGDELGIARNHAALDAVEIVPRYGEPDRKPSSAVTLFGQEYAMPSGIAPVGMDGLIWPGATKILARTAQKHKIPYVMGTLATGSLEEVADIAGDVLWFQLYPVASNDHEVTFDLAQRAESAGVKALMVTIDIPTRARRVRDLRNDFRRPLRVGPRRLSEILMALGWLAAFSRHGTPRFGNMVKYVGQTASNDEVGNFVQREIGGGFTWEVLARLRDRCRLPLLVKGVMHPHDAERAIELGFDGVVVSNHGGRQFDAAPAAIDMLPSVRDAVGTKAIVMFDSGIRSGLDIIRAVRLGADATVSGRAFMLGLCGFGPDGPDHIAEMFKDELKVALVQSGAWNIEGIGKLDVRHLNRFRPDGDVPFAQGS